MERIRNMGLKKSFFLLSALCMLVSLLLVLLIFAGCRSIRDDYPAYGIVIDAEGMRVSTEEATFRQKQIVNIADYIQLVSCIVIPVCGLGTASILFYQIKLKKPLAILQMGTERIQKQDLDFQITETSADELGRICKAFETMRAELLKTNRKLWQQAEERRRLNAAFSHDLRNPVMVLKGTVKLLRQGICDEQSLERLEAYTLRIEQYIEVMSSIQRLEQMPVKKRKESCPALQRELEEAAKALAPSLSLEVSVKDLEMAELELELDRGIFLTVAENLISNAARFAKEKLAICLTVQEGYLLLSVKDDGAGYPEKLLQEGPKPFGKVTEDAGHFGMGLYSCQLLCQKHGGTLYLYNRKEQGAEATAVFQVSNFLAS